MATDRQALRQIARGVAWAEEQAAYAEEDCPRPMIGLGVEPGEPYDPDDCVPCGTCGGRHIQVVIEEVVKSAGARP